MIRTILSFAWMVLLITATAAAAAETQIVRLWPGDPPATQPYDATDQLTERQDGGFNLTGVRHPSLAVYLPAATTQPATRAGGARPAIIICPGGGYARMAITKEGTRIGEALSARGVVGLVLRYRLPDGRTPSAGELPAPQQDVLRAVQTVRSRAAEWDVDPQRIGVIGFSAGGHCAASAATMFDEAATFAAKAGNDAISKISARPDFAVLMYPVISMDAAVTHRGSRRNLIGEEPDDATVARFSVEKRVTAQTPPLLIITALDDKTVVPANSLQMAAAAAEQRVPCTMLMIQSGGHGFGLGDPAAETGQWFDMMFAWLKSRRMLE